MYKNIPIDRLHLDACSSLYANANACALLFTTTVRMHINPPAGIIDSPFQRARYETRGEFLRDISHDNRGTRRFHDSNKPRGSRVTKGCLKEGYWQLSE